MPVYSMTGYASASAGTGPDTGENTESTAVRAGTVTVELRSVNSRFLDLTLRLPDELRALEPGLREQLTQAFKRGKIELRLAAGRVVEIPEFQAEVRERQRRGLAVAPVFDLQRMPVERNLAESDAPRTAVTGVRCRFGRRH